MRNFFHGLSWAQVAAGALAAVTSFFLSAKIGVAGSAIGVAIGSIVSAVASQIYKNVLDASGQKFQETVIGAPDGDGGDGEGADVQTAGARVVSSAGETTLVLSPSKGEPTGEAADTGGRTKTAEGDGVDEAGAPTTKIPEPDRTADRTPRRSASSGQTGRRASTGILSASQARERKRKIVVVSVVSALVAVLLTALVINLITKGEGTDKVVRNIVSPSQSVQTPSQEPGGRESPHEDHDGSEGDGSSSSPAPSPSSSPSQSGKPEQSPAPSGHNGQDASPEPSSSPSQTAPPSSTPSDSPTDTPSSTGGDQGSDRGGQKDNGGGKGSRDASGDQGAGGGQTADGGRAVSGH